MTPKRKKIEDYILKIVGDLDKSGRNIERYKQRFLTMSDKDFDKFMIALRNGDTQLSVQIPNGTKGFTVDSVMKLSEKTKTPIFKKVRYRDPQSGRSYLTKHPMMIVDIPVRRLSQYLQHKISLPEGDRHINPVTGQVIQPDKGSALSLVETQVLASKGLETSILELIKLRSGDIAAYRSMKHTIEESGEVSMIDIPMAGQPRSTVSTRHYLRGMMIDSNL